MIIDLSHTIKKGMPIYPESSPIGIVDLELFDQYGVHVQEYTLDGHVGTHIDVPAHLFAAGFTTETMDISMFMGKAQILDCSNYGSGEIIGLEALDQLNDIDYPDFILIHTGWSKYWGVETYFKDYPVASEELIHKLSETKIKGVGLDTVSIDSIEANHLPNHKIFLGSNKIIIENLMNLEVLKGKTFHFSCLPLKIQNGDGSPVRAVGIVE